MYSVESKQVAGCTESQRFST